MNIQREEVAPLNSLIRITLTPEDYQKDVTSAIKKFRQSATMPGFRKGHVPEGMIKKMYGKSFLAEEINKIVSKSLFQFLNENKIAVLGEPLPKENNEHQNNFEEPKDFEFLFEIGEAPSISINFNQLPAVEFYQIEADEKRIDTYIEDLRRKHGNFSNPEVADETCILYGDFIELDENGHEKENGLKSTTTLAIDLVKDESSKQKLIGIKKDDEVIINLREAMQDDTEIAYMLRIEKEQAEQLTSSFKYKILSVNKVEKLDIGQPLFDKVFGENAVTSESEFRQRVKSDIEAMFSREAYHKFNHDTEDMMLSQLQLMLPDDFLKRWIMAVNEKPLTEDQLEKEYPSYSREMKWRMIENKIAEDQDIKIENQDLMEYAYAVIMQQFGQYQLGQEMIDDFAKRYLQKEENKNKAAEAVKSKKVFDYLNQIIQKNVITVSYDEFITIVREHKH
jgi:trigger factor